MRPDPGFGDIVRSDGWVARSAPSGGSHRSDSRPTRPHGPYAASMSQAGSDDRPGAVFLVGNGLSIGASDAFRSVNLTKAALDELPAKALPFVQALAGVTAWDVDAPPAEPRHFEDLAGPLDHLADVLRLLPDASSEDLRMVEAALRREYKRLVACVVQKVMEAGQPPPHVYAPWDTTEEITARLRAASPSAGDLRPFARTLYEFAEAVAATASSTPTTGSDPTKPSTGPAPSRPTSPHHQTRPRT
jgi:hypothetical protein